MTDELAACDVAHGRQPSAQPERTLAAVFAAPVASFLLRYGQDLGFRPLLVEPDADRAAGFDVQGVSIVSTAAELDGDTDVVVTDHHRPELGPVLRDALSGGARWIGVLGNPRHPGPHIPALRELGVAEERIGRVHRPIGLNIGSRTPPEIALATLAGLIADRNAKPGGFEF